MLAKRKVDHTLISLREAANWIVYDNFQGQLLPAMAQQIKNALSSQQYSSEAYDDWAFKQHISALVEKGWQTLLDALKKGHLYALGRLSTTPVAPQRFNKWGDEIASFDPTQGWHFHAGAFTPIPLEFWVGGMYKASGLTLLKGEYIDIHIPKFFLSLLWPLLSPQNIPDKALNTLEDMAALTPYLSLLKRALETFCASGKATTLMKDELVAWIKTQPLMHDQTLSHHLADAMATFLRPLQAQKGGNRKWSA